MLNQKPTHQGGRSRSRFSTMYGACTRRLGGRIGNNEDTKIVERKGTSVYSLSDNGDIKEGFGASLYSHSRVGGHVDVVFPPRPTFVQAVSSSLKHWGAQEE